MNSSEELKKLVGQAIVSRVKNGDVLGVGTGTTVDAALSALSERIKREKLSIGVLPTSLQTAWRCQELGLTVLASTYNGELSWGFDGADQIDKRLRAIKGKGGALLQEKLVAVRCKAFVIVVDQSKVVEQLGKDCAIPVEVIPDAVWSAKRGLTALGARTIDVRQCSGGKHGPVITENGNIIVDAAFDQIDDDLESRINSIVGVVENGLFTKIATEALVGSSAGVSSLLK